MNKSQKKKELNDSFNNIHIDDIKNKWINLIDNIIVDKPSVGTILKKSVPIKISNNKLEIHYVDKSKFNFDLLVRNKDWISQIFLKIFECALGLDFVHNVRKEHQKDGANIKLEKKNIIKGDIISDIIDTFDGELIN